MNISSHKEHKISGGHIEKQPDTFQNVKQKSSDVDSFSNEDANHILLDKRKSWAVEELVAELSKMRTGRHHHEFPSTRLEDEELRCDSSIASSSSHMNHSTVHSSPDDKNLCSSKHALSLESDKADNKEGSQARSCTGVSEDYSKVCPLPLEGSRNVGKVTHKLSDSLEKLAQEIQFQPAGTVSSGNTQSNFSGRFSEPSSVTGSAEVDSTKMDSAFSKIKSKLSYSSSFKTKKEMQKELKHGSGNSVLSTSWENALSECKKTEDDEVIKHAKELRSSGHVLSSFKGQVDLEHHQLIESHSGSDLEVLSEGVVPHKPTSKHWNLVRRHVFPDKTKGTVFVSGSESEENVDESVCRDEGSVSGLSDDILLCHSGTSKGYSDISDGAVSDELLIESLGKGREEKEGDLCSHVRLQKKPVSLSRKNRVRSL
jgi:hypothetical protein